MRSDTATLNGWAEGGVHDVVAVSIAAVPALQRDWLLLPHGGSVGRDYGPVVVAPRPLTVGDLGGLRVGVPGATTTCARLVALAAPAAVQIEVPSAPLERAFAALATASSTPARSSTKAASPTPTRGLHLVCDLGKFWQPTRGLPIPLGGNVIKRALGDDTIARASAMLRAPSPTRWTTATRRSTSSPAIAACRARRPTNTSRSMRTRTRSTTATRAGAPSPR